MARFNRPDRQNPISNFQAGASDGGGAFRLLAEGLSEIYDRVAPVAADQLQEKGYNVGREAAKAQIGSNRPYQRPVSGGGGSAGAAGGAGSDTLSVIREFEGFRETPYWDVNAHRTGYGSDTITDPDGTVRKVKKGDRVSREDAERDLRRRVDTEFVPIARNAVGEERFNSMTEPQKAALTSIAYNYGEIPDRILDPLRSGDDAAAAQAIRNLGGDNDGINRGRRDREAEIFLSGGGDTALAGGAADDGLGDATVAEPPTLVRTESGALETRLYSPYSGPMLRAHNAAAQIGYQSEILNQASIDLFQMGSDFLLDPDGFAAAADGYIEKLVDEAPTMFQGDLRRTLEKEAQSRQYGIMEQKQRDIRQRANNSSAALMSRWSDNYADALLSGDPDEIARTRSALDSVLQAREALPGVGWTTEQSANVFIDSERAARRAGEAQQKQIAAEYKDDLNLIIKTAKEGRHASGEGMLGDPAVIAAHPELAREAAAHVALRDAMPGFNQMTPDAQAEAVAEMVASEVQEEWQLDIGKAARQAAVENRKAWDDDPVQRAQDVLIDNPPPAFTPEIIAENPDAVVQTMKDRAEYMKNVRDAGFTDTVAFLSEQEAEALQAMMGPDTPVEIRSAMSAAIVQGFGPDAITVFEEIGGDTATMFAGKMHASGGSPGLAAQILIGQQNIEDGVVRVPSDTAMTGIFNDSVGPAMTGLPGANQAVTEVKAAAAALYAADPKSRGLEPTSDGAKELMQTKINMALGQSTNKKGETTGGIQQIMGHDVLLPVGVSGKRVEDVMKLAAGAGETGFWSRMMVGPGSMAPRSMSELWTAVGGAPTFNGKPIDPRYFANDQVRLVPYSGNLYRMEITSGGATVMAESAPGIIYLFDLQKLLDAAP